MTTEPERPTRILSDPWNSGNPIQLDGFLERHRFDPWLAALLVLGVSFVLFQVVIGPIALVLTLLISGDLMTVVERIVDEGIGALAGYDVQALVANAISLIVTFGLAAFLWSRLSSRQATGFLRLRTTNWRFIAISLVGWIALLPIIDVAASANAALPWPDAIRDWEQTMSEPIWRVLQRPELFVPSLLLIAVTPAICEELLFRGYVQRQFERSAGPTAAVVLSGLLFGLYHLQPTKALPLAVLGCYFAFLTWRSGSLIPAMVCHFAQNATVIIVSFVFATYLGRDVAEAGEVSFPWYAAIVGAGLLWVVLQWLGRNARPTRVRYATDGEMEGAAPE